MRSIKIFIPVFLFACIHQSAAQDINENNFTRYTKLQGLSHNFISGIVQDSAGYIWIATYRGLNRFDGSTFKQFLNTGEYNSIPDNNMFSAQLLPGNELAIATSDGAQIISTKTLRSKNLDIPTDDALRYWSNNIHYINSDNNGNYGVSSRTGFYIFSSSGKLKKRFDHYSIKDIGHAWMLFGRQVHRLPDGNMLQENSSGMSVYDREKNLIGDVSSSYAGLKQVLPFIQNTDTRMFFLSTYDVLVMNKEKNSFDIVDIRNGKTVSFPSCFNIRDEIGWITKLKHLHDNVWAINSQKNGFYLLHIDTVARTISCQPKKHFSNYPCIIVFSDKQQRLWIGTRDGLFMQNRHQKIIESFELYAGQENVRVTSLYINNDKIFAGTSKKEMWVLDKKTKQLIRRVLFDPPNPEATPDFTASLLLFHPDTLWVGTSSGLKWLHTKNYSFGNIVVPGLINSNQVIRVLFRDSQKNIWVGINQINKIICFIPGTRQFEIINDKKYPLLKINMPGYFAEDKEGNIWVSGDAITRWNPKKQQIDTLIEHLSTQKNRKKGFTVMNDEKGDIWVVVNDDGIAKITGVKAPLHIRNENLVPDYSIRVIPALFRDKIFLATHYNIGFINIRNHKSIVFNYDDGFPEPVVSSHYFSYDSTDGSTWFASGNIICRIPYNSNTNYASPPLLKITEVSVINDSLISYPPTRISLKHHQNDINISLSAINFTDPGNMRFAYRIKNKKGETWIETGTQQNILLTNISPGKYELEFRVRAFDNKWRDQIAALQIVMQPPFWKTNWFLILVGLTLLSLTWFFYKWRISNIRKTAQEKLQVQQLKAEDYKNRLELEQISNYFSSSLAGKKNIEEILWDVAKNLIGRMGYVDCMIYLWNADKTKMIQKAGFGPKGSPEAIASQVFDAVYGQGVVGYVMQTKKPVLIPDTRKDTRYRVDEMARLSEICVPIIHNGELLGIIDSEHHELNYYKERDLKILTTIATLTGDKIKQIESEQSLEIKQEELVTINEQLAEAQLSALQTQMNPHFIFNALNSIKRMILDEENQKASRYMSKFGLMIRLTLNHSKEIFVTLRETIEYLRTYLEMEQLRFDDSFTYCIKADDDLDEEDTMIPSLMIQPLVENAIWHGLMHVEGEKKIMINFSQLDDKIICTIEDNGIGIRQSEKLKLVNKPLHQSVGLDNLRNRIKIMNEKYNTDCILEITDMNEKDKGRRGTLVVLSFKIINQ